MISFIFSEDFLMQSVSYAIPIIFAAFAALISNRAGITNINIEGSMSVAAVCGTLVSHFSGSWVLGLLVAIVAGMCMSMILAFAALVLKTDNFLTGIALNTLASGLSVSILYAVLQTKGDSSTAPAVKVPTISIPYLKDIPVIGKLLFNQNLLFYIAIFVMVFLLFLLKKTKLGKEIRATGFNATASESVGINTKIVKVKALLFCGAFAGLGGAYLSMCDMSYFSAGMVAGRGFIGIAAEAMGMGSPVLTVLFSWMFGAVDYFAVGSQTILSATYAKLLKTLPYLMTLIALVIYAIIRKNKQKKK